MARRLATELETDVDDLNDGPGRDREEESDQRATGRPELTAGPGMFARYKAELGRYTRTGTFVALAAMGAWGTKSLYDLLAIYEGDEAWRILVTTGIPLLFAAIWGALSWWLSYVNRGGGDFMIATEGEMKKVSWSSRREVIGSTKVVIIFTFLFALLLFVVDVLFQRLFQAIGVLKV